MLFSIFRGLYTLDECQLNLPMSYRGVPTLPQKQISGKRIGHLDFNMPDPFVLKGDKLPLEMSDSGLFSSPYRKDMHAQPSVACMCMGRLERIAVGHKLAGI